MRRVRATPARQEEAEPCRNGHDNVRSRDLQGLPEGGGCGEEVAGKTFLRLALSKKRGLVIIEDCCQTAGGSYTGHRLGDLAQLGRALKEAEIGTARILIDVEGPLHNIDVILSNVPSFDHYRIVVESLPSFEVLRFIQSATGTRKFMVVHRPFLEVILGGFEGSALA